MTTLTELKATLADVAGTLYHGTDQEVCAIADRLIGVVDGPEHFTAVAGWLATMGALPLQQIRASLPPAARNALIAPAPFDGDESPQHRTAMQMITARANDDIDMLLALAKPYAFMDPHTPAECGALIADLLLMSRALHGHVCGGGHL